MIVPMKRLTVVMLRSDQERSLALLQDLGVLHLVAEKPAEGGGVAAARARLRDVKEAAQVLRRSAARSAATEAPTASGAPDAYAVTERSVALARSVKELEEDVAEVERELARFEPFGDVEPGAIEGLQRNGVGVRLLRVPPRWSVAQPEGIVVREVGRDAHHRFLAVVGSTEALSAARLGEGAGAAEEVALPREGPVALRARRDALLHERDRALTGLQELATRLPDVEAIVPDAEDRVAFEEARAATAASGPIALVRGYCPEPELPRVEAAAKEHGWGTLVEDIDDPGEVPTAIRLPAWVRPIQALFSFTGVLPGYDQIDVSLPFLLFFTLFFAMIVGDAGYGLIFLALTEFGRWRMPKGPRTMFSLLRVLSIATIVWGVLTGTYFGIALLPHPLKAVQVSWLEDPNHMILLSFLLGAIHLSVAHGWNVVRLFPSRRALAQAGWICTTWTMFFLAREMVLGGAFPHVMVYVLAAGIVLIAAFMTPPRLLKSEWFNHVMLPLSLVSNFVDLVSYVRLFAVGAATVAIAQAFNQMAVGSGVQSVVAGLIAALVLFLGHTLNILLATMGVLVHGVRLNMLEFASHLGMEWTGRPYRPFAHNHQPKEGA